MLNVPKKTFIRFKKPRNRNQETQLSNKKNKKKKTRKRERIQRCGVREESKKGKKRT